MTDTNTETVKRPETPVPLHYITKSPGRPVRFGNGKAIHMNRAERRRQKIYNPNRTPWPGYNTRNSDTNK